MFADPRPAPLRFLAMNLLRCLTTFAIPAAVAAVTTFATDGRRAPQDPETKRATPAPQDRAPVDEKKVRELLELVGYKKLAKEMMEEMMKSLGKMPGLPEGFADRFLELAKVEDLVEMQVPIYQRHVDGKDIDAILAFMRSDVGKRWNAVQAEMQKEGMAAGQEWGRKLGAKVSAELAEKKK